MLYLLIIQKIKKYTKISNNVLKKGIINMARMKFIYAIAIIAALIFAGVLINLVSSLF